MNNSAQKEPNVNAITERVFQNEKKNSFIG